MSNNSSQIKFKKYLRWFWILVLSPFALIFLLLLVASFGAFGKLPDTTQLENPIINTATEVISSDGKVIGKFYSENRTNVTFNHFSPYLVDALVATEDARFYSHSGVDFKALVRAVVRGGKDGGGSTLTQQLSKML